MLRFSLLLLFAIYAVSISGKGQKCLEGAHKPIPTGEDDLQECTIYAKSSCCYTDITEELAHTPVIKVNTTYWNRCGNLSNLCPVKCSEACLRETVCENEKRQEEWRENTGAFPLEDYDALSPGNDLCESYMKKIECFYRCSPHTARWANHKYPGAIDSVPMCQSFCDDWYEACKNDLTCVNNWLTDWKIDEKGENRCKNDCIPYSEMYANGTDLCETMWGHSLKVSDSSCLCLQMNEMDNEVIKLMEERLSSNSSSTRSYEEQDCHLKMDKIKQGDKVEIEGVETQ